MGRAFSHTNNAKTAIAALDTTVVSVPNTSRLEQVLIENITGGALVYAIGADPTDATSGELQAGDWRIVSAARLNAYPAADVRVKRMAGEASGRVLITFGEGI